MAGGADRRASLAGGGANASGRLDELVFATRVFLGLLAFLLGWLAPRSAWADMPWPFSRGLGAPVGVVLERATPLVVEREEIDIDCSADEPPAHPRCSFRTTYFLFNPTAKDEDVVGAFYELIRPQVFRSGPNEPPTIRMDGVDVAATPDLEQRQRMEAIASADSYVQTQTAIPERGLALYDFGFRVVVPSGARKQLVIEDEMYSAWYQDWHEGWSSRALTTRHWLLGPRDSDWTESQDELLYILSPLAAWTGDPEIHVRIKHRARAGFYSRLNRYDAERSEDIVTEKTVLRASRDANVSCYLRYAPFPIQHGGPLIGIGPRIGRAELHTRVGYEVGLRRNFILGAVVDTDFDRYVTPALTVDVATPSFIYVIPSLSFGAGGTVQFRKDTDPRIGIRTQLGVSWPLVSVSFPIDVYPSANSSGSHVEAAFLTQLSF